ncbi:MAG: hypothetical protein A3C35_05720 [Omnitrophica bacterium RIFCSPHIGHO2_02_FULL_46_11]|nr:MAG: hypothetical protein A3C35_05720 [Omnitrophica bacterium RIFCSPHIGHO2_02_FULL_46_11]OGW86451.1 MAG: hypothetical protein A3A81_02660 [Omnitrophica bacterium RIFCSPLOWO2_01_FULL_45_10b]
MKKDKETLTRRRLVKNIFGDRSSLALRALLREPDQKWILPDLEKEGVSLGLASDVLSKAEAQGYVERVIRGPESYTRLIRKDALLKDWVNAYAFEQNDHEYYLSTNKNFLKTCAEFLQKKKKPFALALYSASRLVSPYVKDERHFIYVDIARDEFPVFLKEIEAQLNLYKLIRGGNVCFAVPFYRSSVFRDSRKVKGFPVVSHLQLYLDLMTFPPTGPEEARHLISHFKKKGHNFV